MHRVDGSRHDGDEASQSPSPHYYGVLEALSVVYLFKVLLNEQEATLPIPTDYAPYYKWAEFRRYCLDKLSKYNKE